MSDAELVQILEDIARDPKQYPSARVTAIRTLREIKAELAAKESSDGFRDLDEVGLRRQRARGAN